MWVNVFGPCTTRWGTVVQLQAGYIASGRGNAAGHGAHTRGGHALTPRGPPLPPAPFPPFGIARSGR
jgi:hypothetical protein